MVLNGVERLRDFVRAHPDAEEQVNIWQSLVEAAEWKTPHDVRASFPRVSLPGKQQAIFDILWNRYRIWVKIAYQTGIVLVKGIGTHKEYEKWDIE